ncbi:MAG: 50S ribosomal protein L25/general stress protein Ctc [Rhodospirillales bacterium]|nr:50S ribosomal protein L25/general stress protein Ctc [Rhodospirillales bacterium]
MAEIATMSAEIREGTGKGVARAHRRMGRVPAVIYGNKIDPLLISLDAKQLGIMSNDARFFIQVVDVNVGGEIQQVLPRDVQLHPVTDRPLHVDFLRFNEKTRVVASVPVSFKNHEESPGLARGGVLNIVRREVELMCSPLSIPQDLEFDLTGLEIGDSIHIHAIHLPSGVEPLTDRDFTVATVAAPTVMTVEDDTPGVEGAEGEEGEVGVKTEAEDAGEESGDSDDSDD